ncbi:hypothetical protein ACJX0J_008868, partial [Zea mays]
MTFTTTICVLYKCFVFLLFLCYGMNIRHQFNLLIKCFKIDIVLYLIRDFEKDNGMVKLELLEEQIFNSITWAPRIWDPWDNLFHCRDRYAEYDWGLSYGYWSGSIVFFDVGKLGFSLDNTDGAKNLKDIGLRYNYFYLIVFVISHYIATCTTYLRDGSNVGPAAYVVRLVALHMQE